MTLLPSFRAAVCAVTVAVFAAPALAQTKTPPVPAPNPVPFSPLAKPLPAKLPVGVAARVNGKEITLDALAAKMRLWQGSPMVQAAVRDLVIAQEAKKYNVSVTNAELNAELYQFKQEQVDRVRSNGGGMITWRDIAARDGVTDAYLSDYVKNQILARKTYAKFVESKVQSLDEQIKIAIIAVTSFPTEQPKPGDAPDTPEAKAKRDTDAKAKIVGIAADIKANKISFADAAKQYSADRDANGQGGSAARGGELPWIARVQPNGVPVGDPAFIDAAFGLAKPGDMTAPVVVPNGYLLIKLIQKGTDATPDEKATYRKSQMDAQTKNPEAFQRWTNFVLQSAKVEYAAASGVSNAIPKVERPGIPATPAPTPKPMKKP